MSRRAAALVAMLLCLPLSAAQPVHVMSLNLCADQLLLALLPPERIASITWLSRTEGDPLYLPLAGRLPVNHGSAEEVLLAKPDLVIAGRYTTTATRMLLRRVGVPLLEIEAASDWQGVRDVTRTVAAAVGEVARGEALLADMDADLAALAARGPQRSVRVIGWGGTGDDVPGRDTFFNTIVETAGGSNVAATGARNSTFDLEQVLRAQPEVLLRGAAYSRTPSLRNTIALHRVLREKYTDRLFTYPEAVYGCGVPRASQLAIELAGRLDRVRAMPPP